MQLTIYRFADDLQQDPTLEEAMRGQWGTTPPEIGQRVGMGCHSSFEVVCVHSFQAKVEAPVEAVHIAWVALPGSSAQIRWSLGQTFFIHLEAVGLPPLSYGLSCLDEPPEVGEALLAGVPLQEGATRLQRSSPLWVVDRFVAYAPVQKSPYRSVYVTWCKAVIAKPLAVA